MSKHLHPTEAENWNQIDPTIRKNYVELLQLRGLQDSAERADHKRGLRIAELESEFEDFGGLIELGELYQAQA